MPSVKIWNLLFDFKHFFIIQDNYVSFLVYLLKSRVVYELKICPPSYSSPAMSLHEDHHQSTPPHPHHHTIPSSHHSINIHLSQSGLLRPFLLDPSLTRTLTQKFFYLQYLDRLPIFSVTLTLSQFIPIPSLSHYSFPHSLSHSLTHSSSSNRSHTISVS